MMRYLRLGVVWLEVAYKFNAIRVATVMMVSIIHLVAAPLVAFGEPEQPFRTFQSSAPAYCVVFSHNGKILASGGDNISLWNPDTGHLNARLIDQSGYVSSLAFSQDDTLLVSGSADEDGSPGALKIWNVRTKKLLMTSHGNTTGISAVAFSPDGNTLATAGSYEDGSISELRLWNVKSGRVLVSLRQSSTASVCFGLDGKTLVSIGTHEVVRWNVLTRKRVKIITKKAHLSVVALLNQHFVLAKAGQRLYLINIDTGYRLQFPGKTLKINSASFFPHKHLIVIGGGKLPEVTKSGAVVSRSSGAITIWNVAKNKVIQSFNGLENIINSVAFSPDGKIVASATENGKISLWKIK